MAIAADALRYEIPLEKGLTRALVDDITLLLEEGSFTAIIGPSGCGKSTLLKLLAGLISPTEGETRLAGHLVEDLKRILPLTIGYLPQFASFHNVMSVRETLENALNLRLPTSVKTAERKRWTDAIIQLTALQSVLDQTPNTLSGGQLRRLALAEQMIGDPLFLFLDELTSGLDPHSEREMMKWLANLVKETRKTVVLVTHSLSNLENCDRVLFLAQGRLIYDGAPHMLLDHFQSQDMEHIYSNSDIYEAISADKLPIPVRQPLQTAPPPNGARQLVTLLKRQWALLLRDRGQLILHVLLLFTFPFLVAIFAYRGLPEVRQLSLGLQSNVIEGLAEQLAYFKSSFELASLVSGLSMLQVILLALFGANNGAREIAKERDILFKEMRAGLSPISYLASKFIFVGFLSGLQSLWMTFFVRSVCAFPGEFSAQFVILFLTTFTMGSTCLWFSSLSNTPERASLLAVYSVGLQLPLSGAVLALPHWLSAATQPLIAAYWGWGGYLRTFEHFRHFDVVAHSTKTEIVSYKMSVIVLSLHIIVTFFLTWWVLERGRKVRATL